MFDEGIGGLEERQVLRRTHHLVGFVEDFPVPDASGKAGEGGLDGVRGAVGGVGKLHEEGEPELFGAPDFLIEGVEPVLGVGSSEEESGEALSLGVAGGRISAGGISAGGIRGWRGELGHVGEGRRDAEMVSESGEALSVGSEDLELGGVPTIGGWRKTDLVIRRHAVLETKRKITASCAAFVDIIDVVFNANLVEAPVGGRNDEVEGNRGQIVGDVIIQVALHRGRKTKEQRAPVVLPGAPGIKNPLTVLTTQGRAW